MSFSSLIVGIFSATKREKIFGSQPNKRGKMKSFLTKKKNVHQDK